ncbi:NAD-dependent succinate-semialdehyde dehydrogenase [Variovorax terrae]|uniref:4-(hydroxymethyl)benzenesulfonate dehydrogenase n=1 Tax=Variovorax terrae TaxID=2923278 RepID=A0A9X2APW3_9BURK|nr:NAD-dependent succinate-semialdehyde dehydrogenase [Variovorax terrae]MCJ0762486.1 NAD-dependent succinate-semialdehyde dehydrogenase [Variovorax terrae]
MSSYSTPQQYIAGRWREGRGAASLHVTNPANGEVLATYAAAHPQDIDEALSAAQDGFSRWSALTALDRSACLRKAAALLRERAPLLGLQLTLEQGKPLAESGREIEQAAQMLEWFAEEGRRCYGHTIPSRWPTTRFHTLRQPIGPVAAFTPWNFPVMLSASKLGAALAAGCSVVLKPAEETPLAVSGLVRCLVEAGVPANAVQLLLGVPAEVSSALIASPTIRKVSFTGSQAVGRQIAALAGQHLKPVTLELGGHAPVIVCADADPLAAVQTLVQIKLRNAGQICANPSRFFVHRSRYEAFVAAFASVARATRMGDGRDAATTMGPLASERRVRAVRALVDDARAQGARLVCGGEPGPGLGFFYAPTVLAEVPAHARIMQEEPFGPLVPVAPFDTLDEAIGLANSLPVGLAAFGFTQDLHSARRIGEEVRAGAVALNTVALMQPETPFGGVLDSGIGRENGLQGIEPYLTTRTIATA